MNNIICAFVNCLVKFQEKNLNLNRFEEGLRMNWQLNQDSSMVERQARDLEARVRVPVQVQFFLLKFDNSKLISMIMDF